MAIMLIFFTVVGLLLGFVVVNLAVSQLVRYIANKYEWTVISGIVAETTSLYFVNIAILVTTIIVILI